MTKCQCADPECPQHYGKSQCEQEATTVVFRTDMEDRTGTPMCEDCAENCDLMLFDVYDINEPFLQDDKESQS